MADTPKTCKDPETPVNYEIGHKLPSVDDIEAGVIEFEAVNDAVVDTEALMAWQKKRVEALIAANRIAVEGMQTIANRQAEVLLVYYEESTKEAQQAVSSMTTVSSQDEQELFAEKILDDLIVRADRVNDQLDRSIDHIARVRANIAELSRRSADLAVEDTPK